MCSHHGGVAQWDRLVVRVHALSSGPHSLKILIEEPVQGLSHCGGIGTMVGMEPSASNQRLDFALAYFDAEEPQPLALTLAEPPHADGRRRARRLFVAGDCSTAPES
jgi:hypothetical protein